MIKHLFFVASLLFVSIAFGSNVNLAPPATVIPPALLLDGSTVMSGDIDAGNNAIVNASSIAAAGLTMTGAIDLGSNAITNASGISTSALTMSGNADMGSNEITNASKVTTVEAIADLQSNPGALVSLTADDQVVTVTRSLHELDSDNITATNRTFTLSNGASDGQLLILVFNDATDAAELLDSGNACLSATWTPTDQDVLELVWMISTTCWHEKNRSVN